MKKKIVMGIVIIGSILVSFLIGTTGIDASIDQRGTTGNIVKTDTVESGYFPTTELKFNLANLTVTSNYGLLIGGNQIGSDQQWFNFTASKRNVEITTTHFTDQSTSGLNISGVIVPNLQSLQIILYGILNDEDVSANILDTYWLRIRYYDEQIPDNAVAVILSGLIIMGALTGIFLTLFKYMKG